MAEISYPEGIEERHVAERGWLHDYASPLIILLFGALIAAAVAGLLGGTRSAARTVDAAAASLTVQTPTTLRSGLFFEMRIVVEAKAPIADAVIALPPGLWRDMTINTNIPAATEEAYEGEAFAFHYGPLAAGERIEVKYDGQINPPLFAGTRGSVTLRDGDRDLASVPLSIAVLP